jgi:hypothetical protein
MKPIAVTALASTPLWAMDKAPGKRLGEATAVFPEIADRFRVSHEI